MFMENRGLGHGLGAVPPVVPGAKLALVGSGGLRCQKLMAFLRKYAILHGFKNDSDICIHCLQVFNMKWKKNQFGGRKVVWQVTLLAR